MAARQDLNNSLDRIRADLAHLERTVHGYARAEVAYQALTDFLHAQSSRIEAWIDEACTCSKCARRFR